MSTEMSGVWATGATITSVLFYGSNHHVIAAVWAGVAMVVAANHYTQHE